MMYHLWENDGDYIDMVYYHEDYENMDFQEAYDIFRSLVSDFRKKQKIEREIEELSSNLADQVSREIMQTIGEDPNENELLRLLGADPEIPRSMLIEPRGIDEFYMKIISKSLSKLSNFQLFQKCKECYIEGLTKHERALDLFCIKFELESRNIDPPIELDEALITVLPSKYYLI